MAQARGDTDAAATGQAEQAELAPPGFQPVGSSSASQAPGMADKNRDNEAKVAATAESEPQGDLQPGGPSAASQAPGTEDDKGGASSAGQAQWRGGNAKSRGSKGNGKSKGKDEGPAADGQVWWQVTVSKIAPSRGFDSLVHAVFWCTPFLGVCRFLVYALFLGCVPCFAIGGHLLARKVSVGTGEWSDFSTQRVQEGRAA